MRNPAGYPPGYGVDLFPPEDFEPRTPRTPAPWEVPGIRAARAAADEARADRARREAGWVPSLGPGPFMADGLLDLVARVGRLHPFYRWPRRRWGVPYGLR